MYMNYYVYEMFDDHICDLYEWLMRIIKYFLKCDEF